jgi:hypothetical protein
MVVFGLGGSVASRAELTIHSGWDLFITDSSVTTFNYEPFQGVPLGTFDFGGTNQNVGDVDTIVYRPTNIVGPDGGGSTNFTANLVAWQLRSVNELNWGAGPGYYYLTLQSARGGPASTDTGTMTFNSGGTNGTFTDTLDVFFDLRFGSLTGTIVMSNECALWNYGAAWTRDGSYPPVITNVNYLLNGSDTTEDFWPGRITHYGEGADAGNIHSVPEPSTMVLVCIGGIMGLWRIRRKLLRR